MSRTASQVTALRAGWWMPRSGRSTARCPIAIFRGYGELLPSSSTGNSTPGHSIASPSSRRTSIRCAAAAGAEPVVFPQAPPPHCREALARKPPVNAVVIGLRVPREEFAQFTTGSLDRVGLTLGPQCEKLRCTTVLVVNKARGERTVLNIRQYRLHVFFHTRVDNAWTRDVVTVLRGVRARPALLGDPSLPHEVNNELEFVQHLEVRNLGLVSRLGQRLEPVLNELRNTATEHRLLTEQVGFGLFCEGRLNATGAESTDRFRVGESEWPGLAGGILFNRDNNRNTPARLKLATHRVAWAFRCDHNDVYSLRCLDVPKPDIETVAEHKGLARAQVWENISGVEVPLHLVGRKNDNNIGPLGCLGRRFHDKASLLCLSA